MYSFLDGSMHQPDLVAAAAAIHQKGVIAIPSQPEDSWRVECGRSVGIYFRSLKFVIRSLNVGLISLCAYDM